MAWKYLHSAMTRRSLLNVESLEDRTVPSTTALDSLPAIVPASPDPTTVNSLVQTIVPVVESVVQTVDSVLVTVISPPIVTPQTPTGENDHPGKPDDIPPGQAKKAADSGLPPGQAGKAADSVVLSAPVPTQVESPSEYETERSEPAAQAGEGVAVPSHSIATAGAVGHFISPEDHAPSPPPYEFIPPIPLHGEEPQHNRNEMPVNRFPTTEEAVRLPAAPENDSHPLTPTPEALPGGMAGAARITSLEGEVGSTDRFNLPPLKGGMVLAGEVPNAEPVTVSRHYSPQDEQTEVSAPASVSPGTADLLEAPLPELGGLTAFLADLEQLGLPSGDGLRGWVLATALAAMACELARRQLRSSRRKDEDAAAALSWALSLGE
jgi:hypothetical protein